MWRGRYGNSILGEIKTPRKKEDTAITKLEKKEQMTDVHPIKDRPQEKHEPVSDNIQPINPIIQDMPNVPGMTIHIDSKDIASMNPQQIQALFEGIRIITRLDKEKDKNQE